jgi:hypothetical protein
MKCKAPESNLRGFFYPERGKGWNNTEQQSNGERQERRNNTEIRRIRRIRRKADPLNPPYEIGGKGA